MKLKKKGTTKPTAGLMSTYLSADTSRATTPDTSKLCSKRALYVVLIRIALVTLIVTSIVLTTLLCIPKAKAATFPDQASTDVIAPLINIYRYHVPGAYGSSLVVDFANGFFDGTSLSSGVNSLSPEFYDSSSVLIRDSFSSYHTLKFSASLFAPCLTATEENKHASAEYVSFLFPEIHLFTQPSPDSYYTLELLIDYMEYNEVGGTYYVQNYLQSSPYITADDLILDGGSFTPYVDSLLADFFTTRTSDKPSYVVNMSVRLGNVSAEDYLLTYVSTEEIPANPVSEYFEYLGYESGYDYGLEYGKEVGYKSGYVVGKEDGYNEGYQEGKESVNSFNPITWLLRALDSVFEFNVIRIGSFALSVGDIIGVSLLVPLLLWFLKLFAGG